MKRYGVDSIFSWMLVIPSTIVMLVIVGCFSGSAGIFYVAYMEENKFTEEVASWPSSVHSGMAILAGPVTAFLTTRLSIRYTVLLGSLLHAFGYSACYFSTSIYFLCVFYGVFNGLGYYIAITLIPAFISRSFHKYRSSAMGVVMTGAAIGGLVYPLIVQSCIEEYGLKGTFLVMGGINLHASVAALTLVEYEENRTNRAIRTAEEVKHHFDGRKQSPCMSSEDDISNEQCKMHSRKENNNLSCVVVSSCDLRKCSSKDTQDIHQRVLTTQDVTSQKKATVFSILRNVGFHLCNLSQTMSILVTTLVLLLIIDYGNKKGIPYSKSIHYLPFFTGGQVIGRLTVGWLVDKYRIKKTLFMSLSYLLISILCVLLRSVNQFEIMAAIVAFAGVLLGNLVPMSSVIFSDYLHKDEVIMAMSISRSCIGLTLFLRSLIVGIFCDENGSYDVVFLFLGGLSLFTAIVLLLENVWMKKRGSSLV